MKKFLQFLLSILQWLAPFASVTTMINLPAEAARVPLGSLLFWFYLVITVGNIGVLIFAMIGWSRVEWSLRCCCTLTEHNVFRDEHVLHFRPRIYMVLIAALVNQLADYRIGRELSLSVCQFVILPAGVLSLICLFLIGVAYLYLEISLHQKRDVYVTYEYTLSSYDGDKRIVRNVCRLDGLQEAMQHDLVISSLMDHIYYYRYHSDDPPKE